MRSTQAVSAEWERGVSSHWKMQARAVAPLSPTRAKSEFCTVRELEAPFSRPLLTPWVAMQFWTVTEQRSPTKMPP